MWFIKVLIVYMSKNHVEEKNPYMNIVQKYK